MKFITLIGFLLFSGIVNADLIIENAWVKNAPPVVSVRAAYLKIINNGNTTESITKITSKQFGLVEIHESLLNNGVYTMKQLKQLSIPAHSSVELSPKGKHLMLMMATEPLNMLSEIQLTIHHSHGATIELLAPIKNSL